MKEAYLLDDNILLKGTVVKRLFHWVFIPNTDLCGFTSQTVRKRDVGYFLFFSLDDIKKAELDHLKIVE